MKICFLTSSYPRFEGDIAGTFIQSLARHLVKLGHEVHILRPKDNCTGRAPSVKEDDGIAVHLFPYAPFGRASVLGYGKSLEGDRRLKLLAYVMIIPYSLSAYVRLRMLTAAHNYDILHAHWVLPGGAIATAVARSVHRPVVISLHGSDVYVAETNRLFRKVAGYSLARANRVTACSANLRRRAVTLGATPVQTEVIPYGVSPELFRAGEDAARRLRAFLTIGESDPVILALGRLVYKKGFEFLVDAMPRILARWPSAKLVLAGDGFLARDLRARAESLHVAHAVRMPGRVPSNEVASFLAAADVFVVPSVTDDLGNVDGLPNVILEAMAAGKAIVATRVGGIPEVITDGDTGLLVEEKSSESLARAVLRLIDSSDDRRILGENARLLVTREFNWTSIAATFVRTYCAAMTCGPATAAPHTNDSP